MFKEIVTSQEELRSLMGYPSPLAENKVISVLDQHCRNFISLSPLLFLSTADRDGHCDVSPRGGNPGFVRVLDETHLIVPEYPGNRRLDTLRNLLENPHAGLIFLIPGLGETLRVNGRSCIVRDGDLMESMNVQGRAPVLGIGMEVMECYLHCAKSFRRSAVFRPETWPERSAWPNISEALADHTDLKDVTVGQVAEALQESYAKRLY